MSESLRDKQSWYDFCVYCKGALGQHNRLECECECHPPRFQAQWKKACFHNSGSMGIEHPCPECGEMLCWNLDLAGKPSTQPPPSEKVKNVYVCNCANCQVNPCPCSCHKPSEGVEEKIEEIFGFFVACDPRRVYGQQHLLEQLRELVRLAREK